MCEPCHGVTLDCWAASGGGKSGRRKTKKEKVDETNTGSEPRLLYLIEVMLERSVWRRRRAGGGGGRQFQVMPGRGSLWRLLKGGVV